MTIPGFGPSIIRRRFASNPVFPTPRWRWKLTEASAPFGDSGTDGQGVSLGLGSGVAAAGATMFGKNAMAVTSAGTGLTGASGTGISFDATGDFSLFVATDFNNPGPNWSRSMINLSDNSGANQLFYFLNWTYGPSLYVITAGSGILTNTVAFWTPGTNVMGITCQRVSSGVYNILGYSNGAFSHEGLGVTIGATAVYTRMGVGYDFRGAGNGLTSYVGDAYQEANLFQSVLTPTQIAALQRQITA